MHTTQNLDTMSAVKIIETTPFDSAENLAGREYLREQMDEATRAKFDEAVAVLREGLGSLPPERRAAHRGFRCDISYGDRPRFSVNLCPSEPVAHPDEPVEVVYFTGDTAPDWAVKICQHDAENIRQFNLRFLGATEDQCPPLKDIEGQALQIARAFPDEHHARARLWHDALAALSPEQEIRLLFPKPADEA